MYLVKCKFLDEDDKPKGKAYTYASEVELFENEIVVTESGSEVAVVETGVSKDEAKGFGNRLKYVSRSQPENSNKIEAHQTDTDFETLIVIEQLPIITERLAEISKQIDNELEYACALECSEENKQSIKKIRAQLNKDFEALEIRRKIVKNAVGEPYRKFEEAYRLYVSDKYAKADAELKSKIEGVEAEQKQRLKDTAVKYFSEYAASNNVADYAGIEKSGIQISLSKNQTSIKKEIKAYIDKIVEDLASIEAQGSLLQEGLKEEILVEYKGTLNYSLAVKTVIDRYKAIAAEKARQKEVEERKAADMEAIAKVDAAISTAGEYMAPPSAMEQATEQPPDDPVLTVSFSVTAERSRLRALKQYLTDNNYQFE